MLKAEEEIEKLNDVQMLDADLGLKPYGGEQDRCGTTALNHRSRRSVRPKLGGRCNQDRAGWQGPERRESRGDRRREEKVASESSGLSFPLSLLSCSIVGRFPAKNRPNCHSFEPCLPEYVDALLRPDSYFRQWQQLARQCA